MRMKDTNLHSRTQNLTSWFLYSAILAIALIYSWYFFVHVNSNEETLIAKSFRVLAQIGKNIVQRESGLYNIVNNVEKELIADGTIFLDFDSLKEGLVIENNLLKLKEADELTGNEKILEKYSVGGEIQYYAVIEKDDFYSPLVRADAFDGFIIIEGEEYVEESKKKSSSKYKVSYHTLVGEVFFNKLDSLINTRTGLVSGNYTQVEVGAKTYHLFLQPLKGTLESGTIIGGFLSNERFKSAVMQVDSKAVVLILIGFVLFLLSIPFIKLAVMSKYENLNISDVVLILASFLIGTMVLTLLVFYLHHAVGGEKNIKSKLAGLNEEIRDSLSHELNYAYDALTMLDNLKIESIGDSSYVSVLSNDLRDDLKLREDNESSWPEIRDSLKNTYPFFKTIFWMDNTGQQLFSFTRRNFSGGLVKLSQRKYFKNAGEWLLNSPDDNFMLESIISVTSGEKLAALSKESKLQLNSLGKNGSKPKVKVAAMTSSMYSIINTIMEPGFGFCVITQNGDVLFHSNTDKNLQENFINESSDNAGIYSAISGRKPVHFSTSYQNTNHSCYISPIGHVPLYLITFHDNEYESSVELSSLLVTISLCIIVLIFCVFLFVLISILLYRPTTLHRKTNPFFWLAKSNKIEDEGHYAKLFLYNVLGAVLFILFSAYNSDYAAGLYYMASLCLASFYFVSYTLLKKGTFPAPTSINFKHLLIAGIILAVLVNFYSFKTLDTAGFSVLAYQIIMLAASLVFDRYKNFNNKNNYGRLDYKMFIFSWIAIVSYLPAVVYFIQANNYESRLDLKLKMLELAKMKEERDYSVETLYRGKVDPSLLESDEASAVSVIEQQKNLGIYSEIIPADSSDGIEMEDDRYGELIFRMKSQGEKRSYKKAGLITGKSPKENIVWKINEQNKHLYLEYTKDKSHIRDATRKIILKADLPLFGFRSFNLAMMLVGGHLIILYLLYALIRYSTVKIFGDGFLPSQIKYIDESINFMLGQNKNLSINFGHSTVLHNWIKKLDNPASYRKELEVSEIIIYAYSENYTYDIEPIIIKDVIKITVENIQIDNENPEACIPALTNLIDHLKGTKQQVIIASTVPMEEVLRGVESHIADGGKDGSKSQANDKNLEVMRDLLDEIINQENFTKYFYYPIKPTGDDKSDEEFKSDNDILEIIRAEIRDLVFMKDLPSDILEYYYNNLIKEGNLKDYTIKERLIEEIESIAENDYYQILNSCTAKGKFVLYDYAQDQLVNYNNKAVIEALYYKGLIKYDGGFKIFNESFRNYVLSEIDPEKLRLQFGKKLPKGNWAKFKIPLFIVGFGLFILLGVQTNVLSNLSSILTSVGAGLALLTKFSGILSGFQSAGKSG